MTENHSVNKEKLSLESDESAKEKGKAYIYPIVFFALIGLCIFYSEEIKNGVIYGTRVALYNVIPTTFMFSVITDFHIKVSDGRLPIIDKALGKALGISPLGSSAITLGLICGFPIGASLLSQGMKEGLCEKEEAKYLLPLVTNPSLAFTVCVVGRGIFECSSIGFVIWISIVIATLITAFIFKRKTAFIENTDVIIRQRYSITSSIKASGLGALTVGSFIIFFSALREIILKAFGGSDFASVLLSMLEIGGGVVSLSNIGIRSIPFIGFVLSSVGLCGALQALSFFDRDIDAFHYLKIKLTESLICAALLCLITFLPFFRF